MFFGVTKEILPWVFLASGLRTTLSRLAKEQDLPYNAAMTAKRLKILYLDPADFIGGAERFTADLLTHLPADLEVILLTSDPRNWQLPHTTAIHPFPLPRLRPFRPIALLRSVLRLRHLAQTANTDLIHSNSVRSGLIAAVSGLPFTHFAHDFTTPRLLAPLLNRARQIFCCSEAVKADLVAKGVLESKLAVIPNGVVVRAAPQVKKISHAPTIAIVGRIDTWKGQDVFLEMAELLHARLPLARFEIFGASTGHDPRTVAFEKQLHAKASGKEFITFRGQVPAEEIYPRIDLLIQASTKPEPFGRTIIEALNTGVPVIATNAGGAREIMTGELSRFLVPPNSAATLAEKVMEVISSETLQNAFAAAARKRVQDFELSKVAARLCEHWQNIQP